MKHQHPAQQATKHTPVSTKRRYSIDHSPLQTAFALIVLSCLAGTAKASTTPPPMSNPCQADWGSRQPFRTEQSITALRYLEYEAERGVLAAQYRLGMISSTKDGPWETDHTQPMSTTTMENLIRNKPLKLFVEALNHEQ